MMPDRAIRQTVVIAIPARPSAPSRLLLERARLARDLHDALGHSLTVIALQAGAARRLWDTDRARASAALRTIEAVTHDGLAELQPWPLQQCADSLHALLAGARSAGLVIQTSTDDLETIDDPELRRVIYRVVQESLTNILKHAPDATARLTIRRIGHDIELTVTNTRGPDAAAVSGADTGQGLTGMQSRVAAYGGHLEWGPQPDGGFRVHAQLSPALVPW